MGGAKLRLALGSVKDHASIGKAMLSNHYGLSAIEIAVVHATCHDHSPIDDQNMHQILFLVSNTPRSIPFLAERISRRLIKTRDPLVALKSLLLIHRLLRGGNRCFEQQLRGAHISGHLQITTHSFPRNSDPSLRFLHNYRAYLEERMSWVINQAGKLEPIIPQSFSDVDDHAFHILPRCQVFLERILDFSPLPWDNLSQAAINNILKESFQVYAMFCEGVTTLVNIFFELTTKARQQACDILKWASTRSLELYDLYENCKRIMGNKNLEYPTIEIMDMEHVLELEKLRMRRSTLVVPPKITASHEDWSVFGSSMETKISKVWVVFEEEDPKQPSLC